MAPEEYDARNKAKKITNTRKQAKKAAKKK